MRLKFILALLILTLLVGCSEKESTQKNKTKSQVKPFETVVTKKTFSYDSVHRVVKEELGNGKYIEYIYDESGNLLSQKVVK